MTHHEAQGAVDVLTPRGPLNEESREAFTKKVAAVALDVAPQIVVNLSESPLVDSQGLESLLDVRDAARQRGGVVKLAAAPVLVADVLHATGVDDYFERYEDVRTAVGSFAR